MKALKRKLFLSIASLAVCAATLVSTTFAWYTSNTEVSASGVTGTSQANGDGLLVISKTGADGTFSNSVTLDINTGTLIPVQYKSGSNTAPTINAWDIETAAPSTSTASSGAYISFSLWFRGIKGESGVNVNLKKLKLTNTTGTLPAKDVLTTTGLGGVLWDATAAPTYTVNILRTLMIGYTVELGSPNDTDNDYQYAMNKVGIIDPEALCGAMNDTVASKTTDFNAHEYYKEVTGNQLTVTDPAIPTDSLTTASSLKFGTTPGTTASYNALKVTFYVFINGWDKACFDAVQDQTFTLELGFSSEEVTVSNQ